MDDVAGAEKEASPERKTVLHVGCGWANPQKLHSHFRSDLWHEVRVDIDRRVKPDIVADISNLSMFADGSVDAVWSSHNLEHVHDHQVPAALSEFRRVLKGDGFALLTMPDLEAVAKLVVEGKLDTVAYESPAGPITALDMIYGHRKSIEAGNLFMCHRTGFTRDRLGNLLVAAGFVHAVVGPGPGFSLWAVALMPEAPRGLSALVTDRVGAAA